jgi:hypothetical protein
MLFIHTPAQLAQDWTARRVDFSGYQYGPPSNPDSPHYRPLPASPPAVTGRRNDSLNDWAECRCLHCTSHGWYALSPLYRFWRAHCDWCAGAAAHRGRRPGGWVRPRELWRDAWRTDVRFFLEALRNPTRAARRLRADTARDRTEGSTTGGNPETPRPDTAHARGRDTGRKGRRGRGTTMAPAPHRASAPRPLLAAALAAAQRGWPVFPLHPGGKIPAIKHWEDQASTDPEQLTRWWDTAPYNIGIACGPANLVVLDLDTTDTPTDWGDRPVRHGREVLADLAARAGQPDPSDTLTVHSPSGGEHRYFTAPAGVRLRNTIGQLGHGLGPLIDVRAHGGAIAAAGSTVRTPGGIRRYRAHRGHPSQPRELPAWLLEALTPPPVPRRTRVRLRGSGDERFGYVRAALAGEADAITHAAPGTRAGTVFKAAAALGELVGAGVLDRQLAADTLADAASHHNGIDGWTSTEAARHIRNGLDRGIANPRQLDQQTG